MSSPPRSGSLENNNPASSLKSSDARPSNDPPKPPQIPRPEPSRPHGEARVHKPRPIPGMHEHKPSHLAPAEERDRILELNRKLEAKRAAETAAKAAAEEAQEAATKAAKLKASAEAAAAVPEILHASSSDLSDAEAMLPSQKSGTVPSSASKMERAPSVPQQTSTSQSPASPIVRTPSSQAPVQSTAKSSESSSAFPAQAETGTRLTDILRRPSVVHGSSNVIPLSLDGRQTSTEGRRTSFADKLPSWKGQHTSGGKRPSVSTMPKRASENLDRREFKRVATFTENLGSLDTSRLHGSSDVAASGEATGAIHSSLAGDIAVSQARVISRAASSNTSKAPWIDKAHAALLENLDEGNEETSLFEDENGDPIHPQRETQDIFNDEGEELQSRKRPPFWKRKRFRETYVPVIACACLVAVAIYMRVKLKHTIVVKFPVWRWLFFFAFTFPIFLICRGVMRCIVLLLENSFFDTKQTLYYLIGIKDWFERTVRIGLITILLAAVFQNYAYAAKGNIAVFYRTLLRLFCCATLFSFGMILKTLAAKMLSSHFNKSSYFDKMQDALRKEYYLVALSQPRAERLAELQHHEPGAGKSLAAKMITPFRFVGSTAMMKRLRTASSPFMHGPEDSQTSQRNDSPAAKGQQAQLAPLLPITDLNIKAPAKPPIVNIQVDASKTASPPPTSPALPNGPPAQKIPSQPGKPGPPSPLAKPPQAFPAPAKGVLAHKFGAFQSRLGGFVSQSPAAEEPVESSGEERLLSQDSGARPSADIPDLAAVPEEEAAGPRSTSRATSFKAFKHPAVAYLSRLRDPRPDGGDDGGRKRGLMNILGGIPERGKSGNSLQSSMMSETQMSLASLESMMSGRPGISRMSNLAKDVPFLEAHADIPDSEQGKGGQAAFLERLHRIEEHIRNNKLRVNLTDKIGAAAREKEDISNINEAKKLAFYIFWNVKANHDKGEITIEDLELFLSKERAKHCFETLDVDSNGKLSLQELRDAVVNIYENRKNLAATLTDTRNVVANLEKVMTGVVQFAFFFGYLAIWEVNLQRLWVTLGSIVVSLTFVFGNNMRSIYEAVVYLFVVHPYDVGDAVLVGPNQDWCNVDEIALQTTTFVKWDGARIVLPNSYLFANMLTNMTRSNPKADIFKVLVDVGTDPGVLDKLHELVKKIAADNPKDFKPNPSVTAQIASEKDPMKIVLQVYWCFVYNATNGRLMAARTKMIMAISKLLFEQGILYTLPPVKRADRGPEFEAPEAVGAQDMGLVSQMATYSMMPQVTQLT